MSPWRSKVIFLDPGLPAWKKTIGYGTLGAIGLFALFLAYCFVAIVVGGGI
jgi:hypothetical protein